MATLARLCASGCGRMAMNGSSLCTTCRAASDARRQARRRSYDERRGTPQQRGYDAKWRKVRAEYARAHPMCEHEGCTAPGEQVDHIVPIRRGGARLDWSNLQHLCHAHHSQKTANEFRGPQGRFGGG